MRKVTVVIPDDHTETAEAQVLDERGQVVSKAKIELSKEKTMGDFVDQALVGTKNIVGSTANIAGKAGRAGAGFLGATAGTALSLGFSVISGTIGAVSGIAESFADGLASGAQGKSVRK